ncbi:hypothetical protein KRP22_004556 [Phytophthora ramorum]|nr:RxLR effector protein PSR2 [Phytophthora ramorum]
MVRRPVVMLFVVVIPPAKALQYNFSVSFLNSPRNAQFTPKSNQTTMRLHWFVALALVACVNFASASTISKTTAQKSQTVARVLKANRNEFPLKRFLRADSAYDANGEERAVSVSGLAGAIKSKTSAIKESAKLNLWLTTRKSAPQVFKLLKIDDTINDVLTNPKMNVLAKYISMYNKKNPNNQVSMVDLLSAHYGGEAAVARMFVKAKQSEATTSLATKLQAEQVAGWLKNDKSTDDVFKILLLDDANANPLGTRRLTAWLNYMSEFNRLNPEKKTTMLQTFSTAYGGDKGVAKFLYASQYMYGSETMAKKLETALFMKWAKERLKPGQVTKNVLNLNDNNRPYAPMLKRYQAFFKKKVD